MARPSARERGDDRAGRGRGVHQPEHPRAAVALGERREQRERHAEEHRVHVDEVRPEQLLARPGVAHALDHRAPRRRGRVGCGRRRAHRAQREERGDERRRVDRVGHLEPGERDQRARERRAGDHRDVAREEVDRGRRLELVALDELRDERVERRAAQRRERRHERRGDVSAEVRVGQERVATSTSATTAAPPSASATSRRRSNASAARTTRRRREGGSLTPWKATTMAPVFLIGGGRDDDAVRASHTGFVRAARRPDRRDRPRRGRGHRPRSAGPTRSASAARPRRARSSSPARARRARATSTARPASTSPADGRPATRRRSSPPRATAWLPRDLPYAGYSAGAALAADRAIVGGHRRDDGRPVCAEEAGEDLERLAVRAGLGLVPFAVDVHATQWGTLTRLVHAVDAGLAAEGWAIDEGTVLVARRRAAARRGARQRATASRGRASGCA